ncbi:hypothetical protein [Gloeocapsa sp. PCC 73106]|uniref:hypothetical protein n=1 Tax=Gloeocapsa sp. PCC 73106 TaxID=102232 RepID=UPI0002AD0D83|nr:hypothetical protein [Gloeocapsa sp. PCC 73106]ELR97599.1 Helix-turn-helix protein [Gloeocapsa sp. PCC 73106]
MMRKGVKFNQSAIAHKLGVHQSQISRFFKNLQKQLAEKGISCTYKADKRIMQVAI